MLRNKLLVGLAATVLALTACGGGDEDSGGSGSGSGGTIKVGTEGTYAPFTYHDPSNNQLTGYDVEVTKAVAAKLGRKVEFSESTFDAIFAGLEAKRYDVIANQITVNPERQAKYDFTTPYTVSSGVIVTRADDSSVKTLADIKGKTSAQSLTSNWAGVAKDAGAKVEGVEGLTQAIALLKQGRVDVTVNDSLAILDYLKTSGDTSVKIAGPAGETSEQAFALRKDSDLTPEFDQALKELAADGTLTKISEKYFGQDVSSAAAGATATATASASASSSPS